MVTDTFTAFPLYAAWICAVAVFKVDFDIWAFFSHHQTSPAISSEKGNKNLPFRGSQLFSLKRHL